MKPYLHTPPDRLWHAARCQRAINVSGDDCFFLFLWLSGELNDSSSIFNHKPISEKGKILGRQMFLWGFFYLFF